MLLFFPLLVIALFLVLQISASYFVLSPRLVMDLLLIRKLSFLLHSTSSVVLSLLIIPRLPFLLRPISRLVIALLLILKLCFLLCWIFRSIMILHFITRLFFLFCCFFKVVITLRLTQLDLRVVLPPFLDPGLLVILCWISRVVTIIRTPLDL